MLVSSPPTIGPSDGQPVPGPEKKQDQECGHHQADSNMDQATESSSPRSPSSYSSAGDNCHSPASTSGSRNMLDSYQISGLTKMSASDREDDSELKSLAYCSQDPISDSVSELMPSEKTLSSVDIRFLVRRREAGAIIGRRGLNIKRLRETFTGSAFDVPDTGNGPERVVRITTDYISCRLILEEITNVLHEKSPQSDDQIEVKILIHSSQAGSLIGKGGQAINKLRNDSKAAIKIYELCCPYSSDRVCAVKAKQSVVVSTLSTILDILRESPIKGTSKPYDALYFDPILASKYGGYLADEEILIPGSHRVLFGHQDLEGPSFMRASRHNNHGIVHRQPSNHHYNAHERVQDTSLLPPPTPESHMKTSHQQPNPFHLPGPYPLDPMLGPIGQQADHSQFHFYDQRHLIEPPGQPKPATDGAVMAAKMAAVAAADIMAAALRNRYHPYSNHPQPLGQPPNFAHQGFVRGRNQQVYGQHLRPTTFHHFEPRHAIDPRCQLVGSRGPIWRSKPHWDRGTMMNHWQRDPNYRQRFRLDNRQQGSDQPPTPGQQTESNEQTMDQELATSDEGSAKQ